MEKLISYAKSLIEEAKAIEARTYSKDVLERRILPLTDPPDLWNQGEYREEFCRRLDAAVHKLHEIARSIRADGINRVTHPSRGEEQIGWFAMDDLQEAIADVENCLKWEVL